MNTLRQWSADAVEWRGDLDGEGEVGCVLACCWRQPTWPTQAMWFYKMLRPATSIRRVIEEFKRVQDWDVYQWVSHMDARLWRWSVTGGCACTPDG